MSKREFEGRSVAEASIKACEALGLTRSQLKHELVSEEGEALSRRVIIAVEVDDANVPPASATDVDVMPPPPRERAPRRERAPIEPTSREPELHTPAGPALGGRTRVVYAGGRSHEGRRRERHHDEPRHDGPRRGRSRQAREPQAKERPRRQERAASSESESSRQPREPREAPRRRDEGQPDTNAIDTLLQMHGQADLPVARRPEITATNEFTTRAVTLTQELVSHMGFALTAQLVMENEEELHIDLVGTDETRAIGRKGEVLLALQFMVGRLLGKSPQEFAPIVVLDAGSYREKRRAALAALAHKLASRALEERKAVRLSPMNAHDRRVFHLTLKDFAGITSRSEGDGVFRSLLIIPSEFT